MTEITATFQDHFLSVYQSAAADYAAKAADDGNMEGIGSSADTFMGAVNEVARLRAQNGSESATIEEGIADIPKICASFGLRYLEALVVGDEARAKLIKEQMIGGTCDPKWATTLEEYAKYFGVSGTRGTIPYIRAKEIGSRTIPIPAGARVAMFGDWGTGAGPARRIMEAIKAQSPDILVHLGDIYYSGTADECSNNFADVVGATFGGVAPRIPVFSLAGNHDMYSGGQGYYDLMASLNEGKQRQQSSFFCLRSEDDAWQLLAMDTGLHDYSPLSVTDALTFVEDDEQDWLFERVREFAGRTILLSHHQLFSAFSQIGKKGPDGKLRSYNPNLLALFRKLKTAGDAAAWFWGHEHNLCIYAPYMDLERGRCVGHGAIPIYEQETPYKVIEGLVDFPKLVAGTELETRDGVYQHGFAMLSLGRTGGRTKVEYFRENGAPFVEEF